MAFKDARQCTAKSKRTDRTCGNPARRGRAVCRNHDGNTQRRPESPRFMVSQSNYRPQSNQQTTDKKRKQPDDFAPSETNDDLSREIALNNRRMEQLLVLLDDSGKESEKVWKQIHRVSQYRSRLLLSQSKIESRKAKLEIKLNQYIRENQFDQFAVAVQKVLQMSSEEIRAKQIDELNHQINKLNNELNEEPNVEPNDEIYNKSNDRLNREYLPLPAFVHADETMNEEKDIKIALEKSAGESESLINRMQANTTNSSNQTGISEQAFSRHLVIRAGEKSVQTGLAERSINQATEDRRNEINCQEGTPNVIRENVEADAFHWAKLTQEEIYHKCLEELHSDQEVVSKIDLYDPHYLSQLDQEEFYKCLDDSVKRNGFG